MVWRVGRSGMILEAHPHDDFGDGLLDLAFQFLDSLLVHKCHQSDFFVFSVFNCCESIDTNFSAATLTSSLPCTLSTGSNRTNWIAVIATSRWRASGQAYCQFFDPKGVGWASRNRASMSACKSMISISFLRTSSPVFSALRRTSSGTLMGNLHRLLIDRSSLAKRLRHEPRFVLDRFHALVHRKSVENANPFLSRITHEIEGKLAVAERFHSSELRLEGGRKSIRGWAGVG